MHIELIARGLWIDAGRVLLCRNVERGYYYLPGGHVEPGERAAAALTRELDEELGIAPAAGECLLVCECLFEQSGKRRHELNLVFRIAAPPPPELESREAEIAFEWVDAAALVDVDLRPDPIKAWLMADGRSDPPGKTLWLSA